MDNPLDNSESYTCSLELISAMQSLENAEELVGISHVESGAIVGNKTNGRTVLALASDFDDGRLPLARILQRVREQVDPDLLEQRRVSVDRR